MVSLLSLPTLQRCITGKGDMLCPKDLDDFCSHLHGLAIVVVYAVLAKKVPAHVHFSEAYDSAWILMAPSIMVATVIVLCASGSILVWVFSSTMLGRRARRCKRMQQEADNKASGSSDTFTTTA